MGNRNLLSKLLFGLSVTAVICAVLTVIPFGGVAEKNVMGYKSICSFAPVSTVILFMLANLFSFIRKKKLCP